MVHAYKRVWRGAAVLGILLASMASKGMAQWTALPQLGEVRYASQAAVVNGKLFFWDGVPTGDVQTYYFADTAQVAGSLDLANPTAWTTIPNLPYPLRGGYAGAVNGKIYIVGGGAIDATAGTAGLNTNVFVFDPSNSSFTTKAAAPPVPVLGAAGYVVDGKIYLVGGLTVVSNAWTYSNAVQVYDPVANTWAKLNNAPFAGAFMASTVVGSDMYMIGGYRVVGSSLNYTNAAYKGTVSGATVTWTAIANYPIATGKMSAGTLGGKVYVGGGEGQTGGLGKSYSYDPATNAWTGSYLLPVGVSYAAPLLSGPNSLVLVGGSDNPGAYKFVPGTPKAVAGVGPTDLAITVEKGSSAATQFVVENDGVIDLTGTLEIATDAQAWLSADQSSLAITAGNGILVTLTGNAASLDAGVYKTTVNVKSNDPDHGTVPVTVHLFVADKLMTQATNVVLEEGTGDWCGYCPYGHEIVDQLKESNPDNLIVVSYHGGSGTEPMMIAEGQSLLNKLGIGGYPNASIQRWLFQGEPARMTNRGQWAGYFNAVLQNQPNAPVAFEIESYKFDAATRKVTATVKATTTTAIPLAAGSSIRLTTVVTEDSINYTQTRYILDANGNAVSSEHLTPYYHNDVARQIYPNSNGVELLLPEEAMSENYVLPGQTFTQELEFTVPSSVKPNHAHVAFILHRFDGGLLTDAFQGFERPLVGSVTNTASFDVTVASATKNIAVNDTAKFPTTVTNTGNVEMTITPSRLSNNFPDANWTSQFCLAGSSCTLPDDITGDPITIQPGASVTVMVKVFGASAGQGKVTMHFAGGSQQIDKEYTVNASTANSVDEHVVAGSSLRLSQNVPNPASSITRFTYNLASGSSVTAEVFTLNGEKVMTVANSRMDAGEHAFDVNVAGLASGVYTVRLTAGSSTVTRMMTVAH